MQGEVAVTDRADGVPCFPRAEGDGVDVQQMTCLSIRSPCSNPRFCQGLPFDEAIILPLQIGAQPIGKENFVSD